MVDLAIPICSVPAGTLLQHVSRMQYRGGPLYYGNGGNCRYDDPSKGYGVLYLGFDLDTALMESVFHQHKWASARRAITTAEIAQRLVRAVGILQDMRLADLTAPNVMASSLGLNLHQLTSRRYVQTQKKCLLIIDLKVGKFGYADAGQMHLYLYFNYASEHWMKPDENPPVGLMLCEEKARPKRTTHWKACPTRYWPPSTRLCVLILYLANISGLGRKLRDLSR